MSELYRYVSNACYVLGSLLTFDLSLLYIKLHRASAGVTVLVLLTASDVVLMTTTNRDSSETEA